MLYYTMDEFVCVLPSAAMEGGIKFHQGILAFVLAKAQVAVSTGKRGKYNINFFFVFVWIIVQLFSYFIQFIDQ